MPLTTQDSWNLIYIKMSLMYANGLVTQWLQKIYVHVDDDGDEDFQHAMHHTLKPGTVLYIYLLYVSHVNTLFISTENRSKHILSHILSLSLIYCTMFPLKYEIWILRLRLKWNHHHIHTPTYEYTLNLERNHINM